MPLPKSQTGTPEAKIASERPVPLPDLTHEGGVLPPKKEVLSPSEGKIQVNKPGPHAGNTLPKPLRLPPNAVRFEDQARDTAKTEPVSGQSEATFTPPNPMGEAPKTPNLNLRKQFQPPKVVGGALRLSSLNHQFEVITTGFRARALDAAHLDVAATEVNRANALAYEAAIEAMKLGDDPVRRPIHQLEDRFALLLNEANAALGDTVLLHWGAQRVVTTTGKPPHVDRQEKVVGARVPAEHAAEFDSDRLAADVAFLEFLDGLASDCEAAGIPGAAAACLSRLQTRLEVLDHAFRAWAIELDALYRRFEKAESIQAAGGWSADKVPAAEASLAAIDHRMAPLAYLIERYRPDLLPAPIAETPVEMDAGPVHDHLSAAGGWVALSARFGQTVADHLLEAVMRWQANTGEERQAAGDDYKRILKAAMVGQGAAA